MPGEVSSLAESRTDDTSHSGARAGAGVAAGLRLRLGPRPVQGLRLAHSIKHKH